MKRKICVVTGTRAEYGLLYPLLNEINSDKDLKLQIIATGMHLSPEFGLTFKQIEKDGFKIDEKVEMLLSSDTETGITKSIGLGVIGFADALDRLKPNIIVLLGDRFEILAAAISAVIRRLPIAHLYGGEITKGSYDDFMRHAITKMSLFHFASTEIYRKRIIQMGEAPNRVFTVGALGIDNIKKMKLLSKNEIEKKLGIKFNKKIILVTFHPATLENKTSEQQFKELLKAIGLFKDIYIIFTMPNADTHGRIVINLIRKYVQKIPFKAKAFVSLGQICYLSCLQHVTAVVGNSSSGIIEAPSFGIPTINIGDREEGRIKPLSVIDCLPEKKDIIKAFKKAFSLEFQKYCKKIKNPYGDGNTAVKIKKKLKKINLSSGIIKKGFHDIKFI